MKKAVCIGILKLDTKFHRFPGDMGNPITFDFPVRYKVVLGATPDRVVIQSDRRLLQPFITAARELEAQHVSAITTTCGFLAMFQKELTESVKVPVFTSSLLQVPWIRRMWNPDKKIAVITANKKSLNEKHFRAIGIDNMQCLVIEGVEDEPAWKKWRQSVQDDVLSLYQELEETVVSSCMRVVHENRDVGAIVFECANLPPYAKAVQNATGRPVFDIVGLTKYVYQALTQSQYRRR
jgi:Asp/Glu/hydantoin racemase